MYRLPEAPPTADVPGMEATVHAGQGAVQGAVNRIAAIVGEGLMLTQKGEVDRKLRISQGRCHALSFGVCVQFATERTGLFP